MSDWYERAACTGSGYDPFGDTRQRALFVLAYCADCPVRRECLAACDEEERFAGDVHLLYGVRGGLSAAARASRQRALRAGRPVDPEPPCSFSVSDTHAVHLAGVSQDDLMAAGLVASGPERKGKA